MQLLPATVYGPSAHKVFELMAQKEHDSDRLLANVLYRAVTDTGQTFFGATDSADRMRRFATDAAASLKIYTKGF